VITRGNYSSNWGLAVLWNTSETFAQQEGFAVRLWQGLPVTTAYHVILIIVSRISMHFLCLIMSHLLVRF